MSTENFGCVHTKRPKSVTSGKRGGREGDVMPAHPEPGYEVVVQGEGWAKRIIERNDSGLFMAGTKQGITKRSTKRMKKKAPKKHYPVVRSAPVSAGPAANTLVDAGRFYSIINRRLMRMGRNYSLKLDLRPDYGGSALEVFVLRDDWAIQKSFQLAYKMYQRNTSEERATMSKSQIARWEDFRVEHGVSLSINQGYPVMTNPAGTHSPLSGGEFVLSEVRDTNDTPRTFTWGSPVFPQYGILQEYDKTGNAQGSPSSITAAAAYDDIDNEVNDQTVADLEDHGNLPPYSQNSVNSATPWVRVAVLGSSMGGVQRLSTGYFTAPCGLVLIKGYSGTTEDYPLELEAKAGDYKGIHAPSMLE